jgi:hypothetical protein
LLDLWPSSKEMIALYKTLPNEKMGLEHITESLGGLFQYSDFDSQNGGHCSSQLRASVTNMFAYRFQKCVIRATNYLLTNQPTMASESP